MKSNLFVVLGLVLIGISKLAGQQVPQTDAGYENYGGEEDSEALNLILTTEHLKLAFYEETLNRMVASPSQQVVNRPITANINPSEDIHRELRRREEEAEIDEYNLSVLRQMIKGLVHHTKTYVVLMDQLIRKYGGTPLQPCSYQFYSRNVVDSGTVLFLARSISSMSLQVYSGLQGVLSSGELRETLASMMAIQAQYKLVFDTEANGGQINVEANNGFNGVMSARTGLSFFRRYIKKCPYAVQGGTFKGVIVKPEFGRVNQKLLVTVSDLRSTFNDEAPTPVSNSNPSYPYPTPINQNRTEQYNRGNHLPGYCVFMQGEAQTFTDYTRNGCRVPKLNRGLIFIMLLKDRIRVSPTKFDHVVAGPAPFQVLNYEGNGEVNIHPIHGHDESLTVNGRVPRHPNHVTAESPAANNNPNGNNGNEPVDERDESK